MNSENLENKLSTWWKNLPKFTELMIYITVAAYILSWFSFYNPVTWILIPDFVIYLKNY